LYLAQEYGAEVYATDLYAPPTENYERFKSLGVADKIVPMTIDATQPLPFAKNYFNVIFSVFLKSIGIGTSPVIFESIVP
jgi:cyclopropane fatty-acyl-phospholipid synthase-like methyltransferase